MKCQVYKMVYIISQATEMDGKKKPNFYIIFPSIRYCYFFLLC